MSVEPASVAPPTSSSLTPALNNFDSLWTEARKRHMKETGEDLKESLLATAFPPSPDEVINHLENQKQLFKVFRTNGDRIRVVLRPIVDVLIFIQTNARVASSVVPSGDAILSAIGSLLQATKGVSALYDSVEPLLEEVQLCLTRIKSHLNPPPMSPSPTFQNVLVESLVKVFEAIAISTKYCKSAAKGDSWLKKLLSVILRRTKDYGLVLAGMTEVNDALVRLEKLAVKETQVAVADIGAGTREVKQIAKSNHAMTVSKELREWIASPSPEGSQDNISMKRHRNTCQWFFDADFEDWKARKGGVYWIYGSAGLGKSVLCSSIIGHLKADKSTTLAYFYFDYSHFDTAGKDFEPMREVVSSLVLQLATSSAECLECLKDDYSSTPRLTTRATTRDLIDVLMKLLVMSSPSVLVLDGLDEVPKDLRKLHLFPFFEELSHPNSSSNVDLRMLVTSRPEQDIREYYSLDPSNLATHHIRHLNLHLAGSHRDDLCLYIDDQLSGPAFKRWPADLRSTARERLLEKSEGMFMWLQLQLPVLALSAAQSDEMIEQILNELPVGLYAVYERILMNFPMNSVLLKSVLRVFECVAFAKRALFPAEVYRLLYCNFDSSGYVEQAGGSSSLQAVSDSEIEADILQKCPGLLEISRSEDLYRIVRFTHFSVREFLLSSRSTAAPYHLEESSAHVTIAKICLSIIETPDCFPALRQYVKFHWRDHISSLTEEALCEPLCRLLESSAFNRWDSTASMWTITDGAASDDTALHWAARLGLCRHVTKLIQGDTPSRTIYHVRAVNEFGFTPLHAATAFRQIEACRILLGKGALVDAHDVDYRNGPIASPSLHYAASLGRAEICDLLVQNGASIDGIDKLGLNPLHHAARLAYHPNPEAVLAGLLGNLSAENSAAFCGVRDHQGRTPLHHAASSRNAAACEILLKYNGATIDEVDKEGHTPLYFCITERSTRLSPGCVLLFRQLLEHRQTFYAPHAGPKLDKKIVSKICRCAKEETERWLSVKPREWHVLELFMSRNSSGARDWFLVFKDFSDQFEQSASEVPEVQELLLAITKPDPNEDSYFV